MEYADSLWAHLGGTDPDVPSTDEVNEWLEKILDEAEDDNLDSDEADNEPLVETTWNGAARHRAIVRTATGEPEFIEAARRIVASGAYEKFEGMLFDHFSASAVLAVWEALGEEAKAKMATFPLEKAVDISFKLINKSSTLQSVAAKGDYRCESCGYEGNTRAVDGVPQACPECGGSSGLVRVKERSEWKVMDASRHQAFGGDPALWYVFDAEGGDVPVSQGYPTVEEAREALARWSDEDRYYVGTGFGDDSYNAVDAVTDWVGNTASRHTAGGRYKIEESVGTSSGQPFFTLLYMGDEDSPGYGVWEPVTSGYDRDELEQRGKQMTAARRTAFTYGDQRECEAALRTAADDGLVDGEYPESFRKNWDRKSSESSSGQTCEVCGDAIAQTDGEWHHDNGEKHDHEAKPSSGGSKESALHGRRQAGAFDPDDMWVWIDADGVEHGWFTSMDKVEMDQTPGADYTWRKLSPDEVRSFNSWYGDQLYAQSSRHQAGAPTVTCQQKESRRMTTAKARNSRTALSLTNVGIEGPGVGVGTDPNGNRVRFTLSAQDEKDLRYVMTSDLAINFTGVDIDESEIIKDASRKQAKVQSVSIDQVRAGDVLVPKGAKQLDRANNTVRSVARRGNGFIVEFTNGTATPPLAKGAVMVHRAAGSTYEWRRAADWGGAWTPAGELFEEAEEAMKAAYSGGQSTLVLLRNNFNGSVTVFEVAPPAFNARPHPMGTYEHFYGQPFKEAARKQARSISEIAREIRQDWKNVYFGAEPYLDAMRSLDSINDNFYHDDARTIIQYFLSNASGWRGPKAKEIKDELKGMLKGAAAHTSQDDNGDPVLDQLTQVVRDPENPRGLYGDRGVQLNNIRLDRSEEQREKARASGNTAAFEDGEEPDPTDEWYDDWIHDPVDDSEGVGPFDAGRHEAMPNPVDLGVAIGDIFVSSWGYEQTNIDFYEVTGLTGASVRVRPIAKDYIETGFMSGESTPRPGEYTGPEFLRRIQGGHRGEPGFSPESYSWARKWDGTPERESHYA